jgi:hypothetical protein
MQLKKIIIPGIAAGIVMFIVTMAISAIMQALFQYNVLELAGMRTINDPIMILFFLYPFVLAFAMAIAYSSLQKSFDGSLANKGIKFGLLVWIIAGIPSAFLVFSSMSYPLGFTLNSIISTLLAMLAGALIIARLN